MVVGRVVEQHVVVVAVTGVLIHMVPKLSQSLIATGYDGSHGPVSYGVRGWCPS